MNDRLKFRSWDDYNREMLDLQEQDTNPYNISDFAQHNIMQCTGLKDKNGKLIYEGDILKDKYGALHPISWNVKGFYEADTFAVAGFYNAIQEDMEVIGNIYENKSLLESEG